MCRFIQSAFLKTQRLVKRSYFMYIFQSWINSFRRVSFSCFCFLYTFGKASKKPSSLVPSKERQSVFRERPQKTLSQMSRNFSGLFRVPQFPLYLRNAEVLSRQTLQYSWFFFHWKHVKKSGFENKRITGWQLAFRARKVLGPGPLFGWVAMQMFVCSA